jgi:hypothetical protein
MKTTNILLILCLLLGITILHHSWYQPVSHARVPQQITMEQILSIRELHLVRHTYNDLFFIHRGNNPARPIRALVQVPVTTTAYVNLKEMSLVRSGDTLCKIILPRARLHDPVYHVDQLIVRETRSFQMHAGKDSYPQVISYLQTTIAARMDTARALAIRNYILLQTEAEAKEYIESMIRAMGHPHVPVMISDPATTQEVIKYTAGLRENEQVMKASRTPDRKGQAARLGFLPLVPGRH